MNFIVKRRQLILATLVVALGAAVFVNWYYTGNNSLEKSEETTGSEYVQNLGEAKYVNAEVSADTNATDYFTTVKLNRQKSRDEALDKLNTSLKNVKTGSEEAETVTASIDKLTSQIKQENDIETLITAKISGECVVVMNDGSVQVVVKKGALNEDTALQITDIVTANTKLEASAVKISEST